MQLSRNNLLIVPSTFLFVFHFFVCARVDWILIIFGTQVIKKKQPVQPVFPDYLSVSYDYDGTCMSKQDTWNNGKIVS